MILDAFKSKAPELPIFSAKFRAIYFEPILGSGERFTIGIMAQTESGEFSVTQSISDKTIRCMYGKQAANVKNLVSLIIQSAHQYLSLKRPIEDWQSPLSGVTLSTVQKSYSNNNMEGILFQGITSYASLYNGDLVDNAMNEINNIESSEDDEAEKMTAGLIHQVKTILLNASMDYQARWQKDVVIAENAILSIDYLGNNYNANLANFDVKRIKPAFKAAKAKLFDLNVLREKRHKETISSNQGFELLIALKQQSSNEAIEHFNMLEQLADRIELRVIKKSTPQELASRIIEQERVA